MVVPHFSSPYDLHKQGQACITAFGHDTAEETRPDNIVRRFMPRPGTGSFCLLQILAAGAYLDGLYRCRAGGAYAAGQHHAADLQ